MSYRESFGPCDEFVFGWLKLVYWDSGMRGAGKTAYSFQLSVANDPPTVALDIWRDGVKIYSPTLTGDWSLCNPRYPLIAPADSSIRVQYPIQRGVHTRRPETPIITFPGKERRIQL